MFEIVLQQEYIWVSSVNILHIVDGRNPAPADTGSLSHDLQSSMQDFFHQQYHEPAPLEIAGGFSVTEH